MGAPSNVAAPAAAPALRPPTCHRRWRPLLQQLARHLLLLLLLLLQLLQLPARLLQCSLQVCHLWRGKPGAF